MRIVLISAFSKTGFRVPRMMEFVLTVLFTPFLASTARSQCGDYIHIANKPQVTGKTTTTESAVSPESQAVSLARHDKCHGPNCSKRPARVPLHPVASNLVPAKLLASLTPGTDIAPVGDESYTIRIRDSFSGSVGHPFRFERPPRR
jgi:hypothetical protein